MSQFKKKNSEKGKKGKHFVTTAMLLLTVSGTAGAALVGLAQAEEHKTKSFNAPAKNIPLPDGGGVDYKYSGTGTVLWSNGHRTSANFMQVAGTTVYCIEPFKDVFKGALATRAGQDEAVYQLWKEMTEYQRNLLNNITYIGEVNNGGADPNINLATQFAMWLVEAAQNEVPGLFPKVSEVDTSKLNSVVGDGAKIAGIESTGATISEVVKYATTILKQAVACSKNPDFSPNPLTVLAGSSATATDKAGVLAGKAGGYGLPFDHIKASEGLSAKRKENTLEVSATPKAVGKEGLIRIWNNRKHFNPHYIYGSINPDRTRGQTLFAASDPANLEGQLKVNVIGLGKVLLQKSSTNSAFSNKRMAGAEFTLYTSDGKPVKWTDGHKGYPITPFAGTKAHPTNVVLKMGEDAKIGPQNLDYAKTYYFKETKAPAGFALNAKKIPVTFDEHSKFDAGTKNFQEEVKTQDIPLGATTLTKVDADTQSPETQGKATLKGVTFGLFHENGKAVEWSEGLTDKTPDSTENLPITPTFGTKADDKKVEVTVDDAGKVGVKHLPLKEKNKVFYWQETRTSPGYAKSTKKYPVVFNEQSQVDVTTHDFLDKVTASDNVALFSFMFEKAQDVKGSLTGLNGAEFTLTPQKGTKGHPIKAVSGPVTDSHGYTVNGITTFDGKANKAAGNPSSEGIAEGDYLLSETKTPQGLEPIDDVAVSFQVKTDKKGAPQTYTATFTDPVTHQEIYKTEVDASKLVDNHVMFKVNLGTFTDKKPAQPAIATTATDKTDGGKTLGVGHVQVTDLVKVTGLLPEKTYTLIGKVVDKETGVFILDKEGKETMVSQSFTTNKAGAAEVQLDFPLIDDSQDQGKEYRVAETVTDDQGYVVVEENDKDNLSQCVKVDRAEGHTEVQEKEITADTRMVTDKFYYKHLVEGTTYTAKISQAYDHNLKKVIDVDGSLTFTAKASSGTVDVPVKIDAKKYAGHKITFYEQLYPGDKPSDKVKPIVEHKDKNDAEETFAVKDTPKKPKKITPKHFLPHTGEEKALWSLGGLGLLLLGFAVWQRDKIKNLFNKKQK